MAIAIVLICLTLAIFLVFVVFSEYMVRFMLYRKSSMWMKREMPDPIFFTKKSLEEKKKIYRFLSSCDSVYLRSFDNLRLHSYIKRNPDSHKWLITVHGYRGSSTDNAALAIYFSKRDWNVLIVENRAHGESEGKWITMGKNESKDILGYIRYIKEIDKDAEIVLHGTSMGAATVMMTAGRNPSGVKCAIEDCGYSTLLKEYIHQVESNTYLRGRPFVRFLNIWSRLRTKMDFEEVTPMYELSNSNIPMLFIHGKSDKVVPCHMVYDNYRSCKAEKEIWITDSGHATSIEYHKEEYLMRVWQWANRFVSHDLKVEKAGDDRPLRVAHLN